MIKFIIENEKTIKVIFNTKEYSYSIEYESIDTSDLIKAIADSGITEAITIDCSDADRYFENDSINQDFKTLYTFLKWIPIQYNGAIKDIENSES